MLTMLSLEGHRPAWTHLTPHDLDNAAIQRDLDEPHRLVCHHNTSKMFVAMQVTTARTHSLSMSLSEKPYSAGSSSTGMGRLSSPRGSSLAM